MRAPDPGLWSARAYQVGAGGEYARVEAGSAGRAAGTGHSPSIAASSGIDSGNSPSYAPKRRRRPECPRRARYTTRSGTSMSWRPTGGLEPHLYRPPPRPRGDEPAGLRGLAAGRAQGARAAERRSPSSTTTSRPPTAAAASRIRRAAAGRAAGQERARVRHRILRRARPAPGHRAHHRAGAGLHAAGHDDRLRRQPHLDPRRLRRARARHRHVRGRACARDPDADPEEGQEHARDGRRRAAAGRHRQGHHPRHHRRDRHGGRHRPCHRILRRGDRRALDGRPDDGLQHVDRGRRARRHDRAGREDLRLSEGPAESAEGRAVGSGAAPLGHAAQRRGRAFRPRGAARRRRPAADRHLGHEPGGRGADLRRRAASRGRRRPSRSAPRSSARSTIWGSRAARR